MNKEKMDCILEESTALVQILQNLLAKTKKQIFHVKLVLALSILVNAILILLLYK